MKDDEPNAQLFEPYLGGKPPEVVFPKQIDIAAFRNLLNFYHVEYSTAARGLSDAGDIEQSNFMLGVCKGLALAWQESVNLERFGG